MSKLEEIVRAFIVHQQAEDARRAAENRAAYEVAVALGEQDLAAYLEKTLPPGGLDLLNGAYHAEAYMPSHSYGRQNAPNVWLEFSFAGQTYTLGRYASSTAYIQIAGHDRQSVNGEELWYYIINMLASQLRRQPAVAFQQETSE